MPEATVTVRAGCAIGVLFTLHMLRFAAVAASLVFDPSKLHIHASLPVIIQQQGQKQSTMKP